MSKNKPFKKKSLSDEDANRLLKMDRMSFEQYTELVKSGNIVSFIKFKSPKTIFIDPETHVFLFINPYHGNFVPCGVWRENYVEN